MISIQRRRSRLISQLINILEEKEKGDPERDSPDHPSPFVVRFPGIFIIDDDDVLGGYFRIRPLNVGQTIKDFIGVGCKLGDGFQSTLIRRGRRFTMEGGCGT